jgi:hypothetical protein
MNTKHYLFFAADEDPYGKECLTASKLIKESEKNIF